MATAGALALVLFCTFLVSCSKNQFVTRASAQGPIVVYGEGPCPGGAIGCVIQESPGRYLAIRLGPEPMTASQFIYTLPYDLNVGLIDGWIGTAAGTQPVESESRLQIQYADGSWEEFYIETDKHTDVQGEKQRSFNVNRTLRAGTVLIVYQGGGYTTVANCLTNPCQDTIWRCTARPDSDEA